MIIDSKMSFDEAVKGSRAPKNIIDNLELVDVEYYGMDKKIHAGQIMVNKSIAQDIREIFEIIKKEKFPIGKVIPIVKYNWNDDASMEDNNSSSFCYRNIAGSSSISLHSFGLAVDINPQLNPLIYSDGKMLPKNGVFDEKLSGTLLENSEIVKAFTDRGFTWRGHSRHLYDDRHHFDKLL